MRSMQIEVFCEVKRHRWVNVSRRLDGSLRLHLRELRSTGDEGTKVLRNAANC